MSATPPNAPPGRTPPGGPNGPLLKMRRPKAADPLVRPKKKPPPRPAQLPNPLLPNGAPRTAIRTVPKPQPPSRPLSTAPPSADDHTVNGFTGPLLSETYTDYPLVTTKRAWREAMKFHVARFASKKNIDPRNEEQFTRPLRLQRRDPRASNAEAAQRQGQENGEQKFGRGMALTEAEREDLENKKAARAKEREENLAQIAPSIAPGGAQKKANAVKQKTQQVFKAELTPAEIARARIRYEEALPWHLEDFDNKNIWVGNYEAAMSETYAMFVLDGSGKLRMVPVDKWYKFTPKNQFRTLTIEEAEKQMAKKSKDPKWFTEKEEERAQQKALAQFAQQGRVYTGRVAAGAAGGLEGEELDFEEDRFADDEENTGLYEEDEEAQLADKRIKKDQLKANVFDLKDEKEYDEEERREKMEKEALKNYGKRVRKALQKREKNYDYSSGSDANPWSEEESTEDSEAEREKEEQRKAEEERKAKDKSKESEKTSGASTKGTATPSDRTKQPDAPKKAAATRKRPGSPNLSDASGTDTSRKRLKDKHLASVQAPSSRPGSRPRSPAPGAPAAAQRKPQPEGKPGKKRGRAGPGSGSDAEAVGSGPDMSDATLPKKIKLNMKSKAGTPVVSRPSSPDGVRGRTHPSTPRGSPPPPSGLGFPTAAEIRAAIPPSGIKSNELIKMFQPRVLGNSKQFIALVKDVAVFTKDNGLIKPKP